MRKLQVALLGTGLLTVAFVVATSGAPVDIITGDGPGNSGEFDLLELRPHPDAADQYTFVDDESGEIEVLLSPDNPQMDADGVNADAVTDVGSIFVIENVQPERGASGLGTMTVWLEYDDVDESAQFYVPGEDYELRGEGGTAPDGAPQLAPGEELVVAVLIDTRETDQIDLLQSVTVYAEPGDAPPPTHANPGGGGGGPGGNPGQSQVTTQVTDTPTPTPTDTRTPTLTPTPPPTETTEGTPVDTPSATATPTATTVAPTDSPTPDGDTSEVGGLGGAALWTLLLVVAVALLAAAAVRARVG